MFEEFVALVTLAVDEAELGFGGISEVHHIQIISETCVSILAAAIGLTHCCIVCACRKSRRIGEC